MRGQGQHVSCSRWNPFQQVVIIVRTNWPYDTGGFTGCCLVGLLGGVGGSVAVDANPPLPDLKGTQWKARGAMTAIPGRCLPQLFEWKVTGAFGIKLSSIGSSVKSSGTCRTNT